MHPESLHVCRGKEVAWKRLEAISHTVFEDNLPSAMTKAWLWQIFQFGGKVVDVFMSWKKRRTSQTLFAFVRFSKLMDAQLAIKNLNEIEIRGCKVLVTMAEYRRNGTRGSTIMETKKVKCNKERNNEDGIKRQLWR